MRSLRSSTLVGRDAERVELADMLGRQAWRVVIVEGEAGIGKTRLISEAIASTDAERVLVTRCPPVQAPFTLGALVEAIGRRSIDGIRLGPLSGVLRPLFPEWGDRLPLAPAPAESSGMERHRRFRALTDLLGALGVDTVVVDDLHWADETTVEFLLHLAALDTPRIGVVVSWRPDEVPNRELAARLTRLAAGRGGRRLRLEPLDVDATDELISAMLRRRDLSRSLALRLHERTHGVPLFIEEMVQSLYDKAGADGFGGEWTPARVRSLAPPPSLRDSVLARMAELPAAGQLAVSALAVLAEPADEALIAQVAGLDLDETRDALGQPAVEHLLDIDATGRPSFRHVLVLDAVDEQIQPLRRRHLHERAAAALSGMTPQPVVRLARHLKQAGDLAGWARYAEAVADLALASGDDVTAKDILLDLITRTDQRPQALSRLVGKVPLPALDRERDHLQVAAVLRTAIGGAGIAPVEEGELRWQLARILIRADDVTAASAEAERAIPLLDAQPSLAGEAMISLVHLSWSNWPEHTRQQWLRRAAHLAERGDTAAELRLVVDLATVLLRFGSADGWAEAAKLPMHGDAEMPQRLLVARGLANVGACALVWGCYEEAERYLSSALELARKYQYPHLRSGLIVTQGHLDYFRGHWDGLADRMRAVSAEEAASAGVRLEADLVVSRLDIAAGRTSEAGARLRAVADLSADQVGPELVMEAHAALAELALAEDRAVEAVELTDQLFRLLEHSGVWIWGADLVPARTRGLLGLGRIEQARAVTGRFASGLADLHAPAAHAALLDTQGMVAEATAEPEAAAALFAEAATAWDALPRPYEAARAREAAARCAVRTGPGDSVDELRAVLREYARLGAAAGGRRVTALLHELGVDARAPGRGGRIGYGTELSPREREVVELVVAGRTDSEIAVALHKSLNTIRSQVKAAKRKLGVSSRGELADAARHEWQR